MDQHRRRLIDDLLDDLRSELGRSVSDADVRHLTWLRERIGPDLVDAVVVTTGRDAYRRPDGVAVVPAALLGPCAVSVPRTARPARGCPR